MPTPKINLHQSSIVDATLERQEQYLHRFAKRLWEIGVNHPHPLIQWAEKAEWTVSGLRTHFAKWAKGEEPFSVPEQIVPTWRKAREGG
jgi:hypothetical protein